MRYLLSFLLCLLVSESVFAQSTSGQTDVPNKWTFRFNVLGLADPLDGNISVGGEYSLHPNWSLTTDLSYLFYSSYISQNKGTSGFIVKPAIRYYTSKKRDRFLEATVFYKQANYKMEDWLSKDVVNSIPAYDEYKSFVYQKEVAGLNIQAGLRTDLSKDGFLGLEVYAGLGVRFRWQGLKNDPNAHYQRDRLFFNPLKQAYSVSPSAPFALRLVYCIR